MEFFNLPFIQEIPNFNEGSIAFQNNPKEYVCQLSKGKADSFGLKFHDSVLITADSIVVCRNEIFTKPKDQNGAFRSLSWLSGKWHSVFTGVTLTWGRQQFHQAQETRVLFNDLTEEQIHIYLNRCRWQDKAGGYGIQMGAGMVIKEIQGCFYNVMGLPINTLRELFWKFEIDLWQHLRGNQ